ncbi:ASF1B isoform 2, partial [Pongo abelii]
LEWKIIYVGSAESEEFDQILDSVLVGPVPAGRHMFIFQADAPNPSLIPETDAVGVTVVLITCTYHGQEFIRVGYYVNNEYLNPELRENPPMKPDFSQVGPVSTSCFQQGRSLYLGGVQPFKLGVKVTS